MYTIVFPLNGWDWLWIGLAIGADIATYMGPRKSVKKFPITLKLPRKSAEILLDDVAPCLGYIIG